MIIFFSALGLSTLVDVRGERLVFAFQIRATLGSFKVDLIFTMNILRDF